MKTRGLPAVGLLLAVGFLLCEPRGARAQGADWPQFRGPGGQGVSSDKAVPLTWSGTENLLWKVELPGAGTSSPIIMGQRVFLTCFSGFNVPGQPRGDIEQLKLQVLCLDRATGKTLWNSEVAPQLPEQLSMRENHGYASSTPVADSERVYAFFGRSGVVALSHDGKQLWKTNVGTQLNDWGSAASPILFGDLLIVNASVESESLVALDKKTGKEIWRTPGIREAWNTPILVTTPDGKTELVVAMIGKILGLDPATGKELWTCTTNIAWYMVPSLVARDGIVYCIGGRSGGSLAVKTGGRGDVSATHRLWAGRKGANVPSPILHDGHLYWVNEANNTVYCADAKTGDILYEQTLERACQVYASPVLAAGRIYYVSRTGRTFVIAAKPAYELLATNDLPDRSMFNASPAVAAGSLFLRSDHFLYCLGSK